MTPDGQPDRRSALPPRPHDQRAGDILWWWIWKAIHMAIVLAIAGATSIGTSYLEDRATAAERAFWARYVHGVEAKHGPCP